MFVRSIRSLLAATALVAVAATAAQSQMASSSRFGINAGISSPMKNFGDDAELGFTVGAHFTPALGEKLRLRINVDLSRYGLPSGTDGSWMLIGGMANLVLPITTGSGFKPYVLAGLGMTNAKLDITGFGSRSWTELAFNGGVGYEFDMGSRAWFVEFKYVAVQLDGGSLDYLPIVLGLKF